MFSDAKQPTTSPDMRSTTTTVTLSLLPLSTAALVRTVAAMRAADWRVAPRWRARRRHRLARLQASWLVSTSHRPSLANSSSSSSGLRAKMVICTRRNKAHQWLVLGQLQGCCFQSSAQAACLWVVNEVYSSSLAESALSAQRRCLTLTKIRKHLWLLQCTKHDTQTCQDCQQGRTQQCMPDYYGI